jgi:hypothetical protein
VTGEERRGSSRRLVKLRRPPVEEKTKGEEVMTDNVLEIAYRLRNGRAVKTEEDFRQWVYEYLERFSNQIGQDRTPIDVFSAWTRVMVEWCDATSGHGVDRENAQALAAAIGELTNCLQRVLALPPENQSDGPETNFTLRR